MRPIRLWDRLRLASAWEKVDPDGKQAGADEEMKSAWQSFRRARLRLQSKAKDTPLILDGMAVVTSDLGGEATGAIVHTRWTNDTAVEQWVLFDATAADLTFTFASDTIGHPPYELVVTPTPYPDRLPWPTGLRPTEENVTFWSGIPEGADISTDGFWNGIRNVLKIGDGFRYVYSSVTRTTTFPAGHIQEVLNSSNQPRLWEELSYNAPLDGAAKKMHVYGEWPGTQATTAGGKYLPLRIHMAWRTGGVVLPPATEVQTRSLPNPVDTDVHAWRDRMTNTVFKSMADRRYGIANAKLFTAPEFGKLTAIPA